MARAEEASCVVCADEAMCTGAEARAVESREVRAGAGAHAHAGLEARAKAASCAEVTWDAGEIRRATATLCADMTWDAGEVTRAAAVGTEVAVRETTACAEVMTRALVALCADGEMAAAEPGVLVVRAVEFRRGVVEMRCQLTGLGVLIVRAVRWRARCACARMTRLTRWGASGWLGLESSSRSNAM